MKITLQAFKEYNLSQKRLISASSKLRRLLDKKSPSEQEIAEIVNLKENINLLYRHVEFLKPYYHDMTEEQVRAMIIKPNGRNIDNEESVQEFKDSKKVPILVDKFEKLDVAPKAEMRSINSRSEDQNKTNKVASEEQNKKVRKSAKQKVGKKDIELVV